MTYENNLKIFRLSKKLSQRELAEKAKLSISLVAKIEQKVRDPSFKTADKICSILKVPLEEVFPKFKRECPYPAGIRR